MYTLLRRSRMVTGITTVALSAFFLASGVSSLAGASLTRRDHHVVTRPPESRPPPPEPTAEGHTICDRNVFDSGRRPCSELLPGGPGGPEPPAPGIPRLCASSIELVGTIASTAEPGGRDVALIRHNGATLALSVNEDQAGIGRVRRIGWRLVLVEGDDGAQCLLDLYGADERPRGDGPRRRDEGPPRRTALRGRLSAEALAAAISEVSPSTRVVSRAFLEELIENPPPLSGLGQVRPNRRGGRIQGFRLSAIRRGTLLNALGLRNGDVLEAVNDIEMTSLDSPLGAFTALRNAEHLTVSVSRRGRRQTLTFDIR